MIREVSGDILDADTEAVVNPVNTVGVMGAGLAAQVKHTFPYARQRRWPSDGLAAAATARGSLVTSSLRYAPKTDSGAVSDPW